jgi:uncharacterized protein YbaP (TraB family)
MFLAGLSWAQESQPTTGPAELQPSSAPTPAPPFLWRVEGPNGPSWLLGTMHFGVSLSELSPLIFEHFDEARVAVLEADVRQINLMELMTLAQLPDGRSLRDELGDEVWGRIQSALGTQLPMVGLERMQPWFLETALMATVLPPSQPMDMVLLQRAEQAGQTLEFLEGWRDQMDMMNALPFEDSVEDLLRWIDEREEVEQELLDLVAAYRDGDADRIVAIMFDPEELAERANFYEQVMFRRNDNWMPTIVEAVERGGVFVAVGLGHLLGPRGLVAQLRERGYTVDRLGTGDGDGGGDGN